MDEPEFDLGYFKERLNNLMMQSAAGHLTIDQCEELMVAFCCNLDRVQRLNAPEVGE